jgi:hypothetical protein
MFRQVCMKNYKALPHRVLPYPPQRSVYAKIAEAGLIWYK